MVVGPRWKNLDDLETPCPEYPGLRPEYPGRVLHWDSQIHCSLMRLSHHNPSPTRLLNQLHRCNIENFLLSHGFKLVALLRILGVANQLVGITDSCDSCSGFGGCARTLPVRGMRQLDHLLPFRAVPGAGVPESLREVVRVPGFLLQQQHPIPQVLRWGGGLVIPDPRHLLR